MGDGASAAAGGARRVGGGVVLSRGRRRSTRAPEEKFCEKTRLERQNLLKDYMHRHVLL